MSWPEPEPGLVVRYSYLWAREAALGREEGVKDRPCAVILVVTNVQGERRVRVLPVTHTPPANAFESLEIPSPLKRRLGLDDVRSWIVVSEANEFIWPGPDLRPAIPGDPTSVAHGMLPPRFFEALKQRLTSTKGKLIQRSE